MSDHEAGAELSRVVVVAEVVTEGGRTMAVSADERERAALAERFGLAGIARLDAKVRLRPTPLGDLDVRLALTAAVTQTSVVTLEPVDEAVEETFLLRFSRDADPEDDDDVGGADDPLVEAWPGAELDVGELVAQHLSLALDPYPRGPGETLPEDVLGSDEAAGEEPENGEKPNPFAVLREVRDKLADR